jgi:hypothetical protein
VKNSKIFLGLLKMYEFEGKIDEIPGLIDLARVFKRAYDASDPLEVICTRDATALWGKLEERFEIEGGQTTPKALLLVALRREGVPNDGTFDVEKIPNRTYARKLTYTLK